MRSNTVWTFALVLVAAAFVVEAARYTQLYGRPKLPPHVEARMNCTKDEKCAEKRETWKATQTSDHFKDYMKCVEDCVKEKLEKVGSPPGPPPREPSGPGGPGGSVGRRGEQGVPSEPPGPPRQVRLSEEGEAGKRAGGEEGSEEEEETGESE